MLYEIYMSNPEKGLVSSAPHCKDTTYEGTLNKTIAEIMSVGLHPIIRFIEEDKTRVIKIEYIVNSKAIQKMELENG